MRSAAVRNVVRAYDDPVIRTYCWLRFGILRQRFLDEIGQYLPTSGAVLDIGCGFGLFSLYYATSGPQRVLHGVDRSARRIEIARRAAARLQLSNVGYEERDARDFEADRVFAAAYMLDIIHHVPPESVPGILAALRRCLAPGGRLLVKDVDSRPVGKRWFTWALDKLMDPRAPVHYWPADRLAATLERTGFRVYRHLLVDILPYPHVLYVCEAV